jgi:nucleotide-binding universal stress UspA family protein
VAGWLQGAEQLAVDAAAEVDAELRQELARATALFGIRAEYRCVRGEPGAELTRVADEVLADAVLVGASEQAGHRLVGSIAVRLVRVGRWPVTVVP